MCFDLTLIFMLFETIWALVMCALSSWSSLILDGGRISIFLLLHLATKQFVLGRKGKSSFQVRADGSVVSVLLARASLGSSLTANGMSVEQCNS